MDRHDCSACGGCGQGGGCNGCGGCGHGGVLTLTHVQLNVLARFAVMPFYPAGYQLPHDDPTCLDFSMEEQDALRALVAMGLLSSDPFEPISGADLSAYAGFRLHGSVALTKRGQQVVELMDVQGIDED